MFLRTGFQQCQTPCREIAGTGKYNLYQKCRFTPNVNYI
jgi:hypothetical protein